MKNRQISRLAADFLLSNGKVRATYHVCWKCRRQIDDDEYYRYSGLCSTCYYS